MPTYDLVIKDGTIIDGSQSPRYVADIAIRDGIIERIGPGIDTDKALRVIDAEEHIVAPGVIDPHTHYDAQVHWDPYCTNSSWHGNTTVVVGNCGFGFAPCPPALRERYMLMMENTEQVPVSAMRNALPWTWETFPQWMEHMRGLPKGINLASFMPLNSLMMYVMGYEAAKTRGATATERSQMRRLLHEAMDAGAIGFGLSHLNDQNSHKDIDGSPMPTDSMVIDDAIYLAEVLAERGEGVIQCLCELGTVSNRHLVEALAKTAKRPVIHNVVHPAPGNPDFAKGILAWLDRMEREGLSIYSQSLLQRSWVEFNVIDADGLWRNVAPFTEFANVGSAENKCRLAEDETFLRRAREQYDPAKMYGSGGPIETHRLVNARGAANYTRYEGKLLSEIAADKGVPVTDILFAIVAESDALADLRTTAATAEDPQQTEDILRHPRVLAGTSDGGAHVKFHAGGQYCTDVIMWMTREESRLSLEEVHHKLSYLPAQVLGLKDRGALMEGKAADLYIYDYLRLNYNREQYDVIADLPGGDARRVARAEGVEAVVVNGEPIFLDNQCTGSLPGRILITTGNHPVADSTVDVVAGNR